MIVACTSSSSSRPLAQELSVGVVLAALQVDGADWLLHGCCVGGDEQIAEIARRLGYLTHGFPGRPIGDPFRSTHVSDREEAVPSTKTPELTRNREMVRRCDVLVAAPSGFEEVLRSGTWATIREARDRQHRPAVIVYPDGSKNMEFAGNFARLLPENTPAPPPRAVS